VIPNTMCFVRVCSIMLHIFLSRNCASGLGGVMVTSFAVAPFFSPQLNARYSDYLAEYLRAGFSVHQIGNTYNTLANGMEQMMTLSILIIGAYTAMNDTSFTIGMLVAFQMFASRLSQPMLRVLLGLQPLTTTAYPLRVLRLVGLWQQFQQANLSLQRMATS
jgi:ATP-binding cassette, subfamily B, bacterial HlyB/CyaB